MTEMVKKMDYINLCLAWRLGEENEMYKVIRLI
jgi:hypothetical protein